MKIYIAKADQEVNVSLVDLLLHNSETDDLDVLSMIEKIIEASPSMKYTVQYGLTQSLSDAAASIKGDAVNAPALTMALVNKRLDQLLNGKPPAIGVKIGDRILAKAVEIATEWTIAPQWKKAGRKVDAKGMREEALALVKRNPAYRARAEELLEREKALAEEMAKMAAEAVNEAVGELTPTE